MFKIYLLLISLFAALINLSSCSHYEISRKSYSFPDAPASLLREESGKRKILLASFNDLNGQTQGVESLGIQIGGLGLLKEHLRILQKKYASQLITLSTGHLLPKTQDHEITLPVLQEISEIQLDLIGVSSREFLPWQKLAQNRTLNTPVINSNIFEISEGKLYGQPPFVAQHLIERNGLKIGFVSVAGLSERYPLAGYYFEDMTAAILRARSQLLRGRADLVVLLLHDGSGCVQIPPENSLQCDGQGILNRILERLPPKTLDLVVTTSEYHSWGKWRDVYVMSSPGNGLYLSTMILSYDLETKSLDPAGTHLLTPTLLCSAFFELSEDCYIGDSRRLARLHEDKLKTVPAHFFGEQVIIDR